MKKEHTELYKNTEVWCFVQLDHRPWFCYSWEKQEVRSWGRSAEILAWKRSNGGELGTKPYIMVLSIIPT